MYTNYLISDKTLARQFINKTLAQQFINKTLTQQFINKTFTQQFINKTLTQQFINKTLTQQFIHKTLTQQFINITHFNFENKSTHKSTTSRAGYPLETGTWVTGRSNFSSASPHRWNTPDTDVMVVTKLGQIGPKWDKSGTF